MDTTIVFQKNWEALYQNGVRYILNSGSSRSSKTHSLIQLFYLYAYSTPNKKLSVFRDTKKICKDTVFEDMKKVYPYMMGYANVTLNVTESVFRFPNGSSIHIEGTDDPIKMHGYHCDILWFNESYNIQKDTFDQLDMRCTGRVLIDLNPRQSHWSDDLAKDPRTVLIHSTFKDNPFCPAEQRAKILSYQPVKRCKIVVEGRLQEQSAKQYDILANSLEFSPSEIKELSRCRENEAKNSADDFKWLVYGLGLKGERPNRIFHWSEISIEDYLMLDAKRYYATDWGTVDPWGVLEAKYQDGCLYFRQLNYASENKIREKLSATDLAQILATESDAEKSEGGGIVRWLFGKLGIGKSDPIACDTNRPIKTAALRRAGYNAFAAQKGKGSVEDGIDLLNNIRCFYTSDSPDLAYEQENYSRKVDRYGVILEEPEDIDNHLLDPARYIGQYLRTIGVIKAF